ncbi:hypothetical protein I1A62_17055 [Rhodococcus sp. USK10]|uniref:hypothetical protein n=1 Tax=Rhodococcus sp. USK10 TaxID=2789739 RepID=UPI001C5FD185|nr:hypothetical protein [Rhodococcus sp. USK10]QYB06044.1 hypothetical protein I1A62_17055 [Rhodococcus sp. USK10]
MTEDSQQISVSELLKRNGQQVESRGGRRRRGVAGGISVAELTGEIPVVRDPSDSRALEPEPEQEPATPEPSRTPAPATPSARADDRTAAFKAPVDDSDEDDDEPIASRPAGRGRAVVPGGTSRDHQGTWVSRAVRKEPPAPEAATPAPTVAAPAVKKPEPAPTVAAPRVTPAPKTELPAKAEPAAKSDAPAKPTAKPEAPAKPGTSAKAGTAAASNGASKFVKTPKPEAPAKVKPEPALLSGSTLAGDLMRQSRDSDAANAAEQTDLIEAATGEADTEKRDGDTQKSDTPRRSRKEAKAEKAEAAKAEKAGKDEAGENSTREWVVLIGQGVVAVIAGALLFKGFEKLWDVFPWVALILALLVIVGLVAMVRILRRTDDITSFVIAVVVGMIVTLGPLAFMLASG